MGEMFDLSFYFKGKREKKKPSFTVLRELGLKEGKNRITDSEYPLFAEREVQFITYDYDDADFFLHVLHLENLVFTKSNLEKKINQLLQVVDICFSQSEEIMFASGIYEMTGNYIGGNIKRKDLNATILSHFPILFFRKGQEQGFHPSYNLNDTYCVLNLNKPTVQDIFANPIMELMENEGLCYEEAYVKYYRSEEKI